MSRIDNITIDKFGRRNKVGRTRLVSGPRGIGFRPTNDGQYDMQGKLLTNVALPQKNSDVATKKFVLSEIRELRKQLTGIVPKNTSRSSNYHTPETNLYNIEKTIPELFMENKQLKTTPEMLKEIKQNQGHSSGNSSKNVKNTYF